MPPLTDQHTETLTLPQTIRILVGTMTGTAELVADEIKGVIEAETECGVQILPLDDLEIDVLDGGGLFIVCTSTYGQGDVPDNAMNFYESLGKARPDLSNVDFAVFGLGDSTYEDTFNFGGKKFDEMFSALGARRICERSKHDASGPKIPEDQAVEWVRGWIASAIPVKAEAD